jgi:hypothetical protein
MNISDYLMEHPFQLVGCCILVLSVFYVKEMRKSIKHAKHLKQIEERKKKKNEVNIFRP